MIKSRSRPATNRQAFYARASAITERLHVGQQVVAAPASVLTPIVGKVVEIDGLTVALQTADDEIVGVHADDIFVS